MHYFIYPSKDTYLTNETTYVSKSLGIDEILEVKANTQLIQTTLFYQSSSVSQSSNIVLTYYKFSGSLNADLSGSGTGSYLVVSGSANVTASNYFTGILTGSLGGTIYTGSITNTSASMTGSISGSITGSWSGCIDASGSVQSFSGTGLGTFLGTQSVYNPITVNTNLPELSRALLKFDITTISKSIANGTISNTGSIKFNLKLIVTEAEELPLSYSIYGYPISQSWEMGNGRYATGGSYLGSSWYYRNYAGNSGSLEWYPITASSTYQFVDYLTTSSYASESFQKGGGTWHYKIPSSYSIPASGYCSNLQQTSSLVCSQSFDYTSSDVNMDITSIVKSWICGCIPNEGIILLSSLELSQAENTTGTLKFYSKDSNTIYTPYIDAQWDDTSYISGSLVAVSDSVPFTIVLKNVSKNYKFGALPRIDVFARAKNPLKNFVKGYQMNQYLTSSLLPTSSYYAIKDNESERMILDFDDYTKLSCNGNVHYFNLDTTSFAVERYYRILIKTVTNNTTQIFDNGYIFKITR